ncbi:MAG: peptidase family protein [Candidatus Saccharibacteria bacterium]|nr:peptidase family protein [Candidatus Saccharibacteria bacterium]
MLGIGLLLASCLGLSVVIALHGTQTSVASRPPSESTKPAALAPPVSTVPNIGLPSRLVIPKLQIDASVKYMGTTASGEMEVPTTIVDVGWYKYGALPGNTGTAVMAGHIDGPKGQPAIFANISKLQAGDTLSVVDSAGRATSFVVTGSKVYEQNEKPQEVFNSSSGAHLNLITCAGDWDSSSRHFLERLVIFTDKAT